MKSRTKVADVAVYQNDGTATISPSHFVERAEESAGFWKSEMDDAVSGAIDGDPSTLRVLATQIAADIGDMCDRIRTGRLKASFRGEIKGN